MRGKAAGALPVARAQQLAAAAVAAGTPKFAGSAGEVGCGRQDVTSMSKGGVVHPTPTVVVEVKPLRPGRGGPSWPVATERAES